MVVQTVYADGTEIYHDGSKDYQDWLRRFENRKAQEYKPYYNGPFPDDGKAEPAKAWGKNQQRRKCHSEGATDIEIAAEFGITVSSVQRWRSRNGLDENFGR